MSLLSSETEPTVPADSVLRMVTADRAAYQDSCTARAVQEVAAYLDDVVIALADAGVRTSSIEIDARQPLVGRLVVTGGNPRTPVLEWRRDNGWWLGWRSRIGARPNGWRMLSGDPRADPADVAGQFCHDLHDVRPGRR